MTTTRKSGDQESTQQATHNIISGTTVSSSSGSLQKKLAVTTIASFTILGLLLATSACSSQSSKPALVSVTSPASGTATPATPQTAESTPAKAAVATTAAAKRTPRKRPTNVTYNDANFGVSFLYPRKAVLTSGDQALPELAVVGDVPMNFVQTGGIAVATVALPGQWYPGTDFASAFFDVNVNGNISEQECSHFAAVDTRNADGEPVDAEKVKVGSSEMETTSTFFASAVKQVETRYYHSFENGSCYEYVLALGTRGFATERGIEPVNRDDVFAKLEKILATVKINSRKIDAEKVDPKTIGPIQPEHVSEQGGGGIEGGKE
jgi:hypothetical protein